MIKIKFHVFLLTIIFFLLVLSGCEKQPFDYRNKYLGNWKFDVVTSHETFSLYQGFHDTTEIASYQGKIRYGSGDKSIVFESPGYMKEFTINKNGEIIPYLYGSLYSESGGFLWYNSFIYNYYHRWGGTPHKYEAIGIKGTRK